MDIMRSMGFANPAQIIVKPVLELAPNAPAANLQCT